VLFSAKAFKEVFMSGYLRPVEATPSVSIVGERVLVVAGDRHLALTVDAAWELLDRLSAGLQMSQVSAWDGEKEEV
jgi:hypothetical protein